LSCSFIRFNSLIALNVCFSSVIVYVLPFRAMISERTNEFMLFTIVDGFVKLMLCLCAA